MRFFQRYERGMYMTLKDNIKNLCKEKGVSMNKLETDLEFGKGYISKLDKSVPNSAKLQKIADYFGVSIDYLLNGKSSSIKVIDENYNVIVLDDEALELIDSLRKNPEMRMLFSVSKKATKEDIIKAVKIIEALRDENESD